MLILTVIQGPDKGRKFELPDHEPQLIGRSSEALPIDDNAVSRRHAELTPDDGVWYIRDLESQNGTYLNGVKLDDRTRLRPGDQIRTGQTLFVFGQTDARDPDVVRVVGNKRIDSSIEKTLPSVTPVGLSLPGGNDDSVILSEPEPRAAAVDHLRVIYRLTAMLTTRVLDRQELLRGVLDLIFAEFSPQRGCILLTGPTLEGPPELEVVKYRDPPTSPDEAKIHVSRTILQHAIGKHEGVLSTNAMADPRFAAGDSVQRFHIRSAICSPIKFRERTFGAIYIDSSMANYTFTAEQLALMNAIGQHAGLALANMGDIDRQSIAGAISTGTHGTGCTLGSISTQVVGLRIVTATGEILECSPSREPEIFQAAQVSLGALGVITQVTLQLLPAYYLHERTWAAPFEECMANLDALIAANRHCEFFWSPGEDACALKTLNPTELDQLPEALTTPAVTGRLARYIRADRSDRSYRIFPSERTIKFNETEFAVPAANGPDCLRELRHLMQTQFPDVLWPIEYRTLAADMINLSPAYKRATVTISLHQAAALPYQSFFAAAEAIFRNHYGRPHWGKLHTHTAHDLRALYPHWSNFQDIRGRLDPRGMFMNEHLHAIFDGDDQT